MTETPPPPPVTRLTILQQLAAKIPTLDLSWTAERQELWWGWWRQIFNIATNGAPPLSPKAARLIVRLLRTEAERLAKIDADESASENDRSDAGNDAAFIGCLIRWIAPEDSA